MNQPDLDRLKSQLNTAKVREQDFPLYQVVDQLINSTRQLQKSLIADIIIAGGSGISQLTGDVIAGPGKGSQVATIPEDTVTYNKMQDVSAGSLLLGRGDTGGGTVEEISLGPTLSMIGTELNAGGDIVVSSDEQGYFEPLMDGDPPEAELITANGDVIMVFIPGITIDDKFEGIVDRVIETGTSRLIANTQSIVVADYFAVQGTGILAIEGDGALWVG